MKKKQSAPVKKKATPATPWMTWVKQRNQFYKDHPNSRVLIGILILSIALFIYITFKMTTEIAVAQQMYQDGYDYKITLFPAINFKN